MPETIKPTGRTNRVLVAKLNFFKRFAVDSAALVRGIRASYLPPLMIYAAAGISGLTGIVGTFFVKEYLGLSAEFLAMLGFWAGIPWALKMPLGHLTDLLWRWKYLMVFIGAALIGVSLAIIYGLVRFPAVMAQYMGIEAWYVLAALVAPIGYVVQDVVADAMTVEAVPVIDDVGNRLDGQTIKAMHTTMQTLGRVAIIGGGILVSAANMVMFKGVADMPEAEKVRIYAQIYLAAMIIPLISVAGVFFAMTLKRLQARRLYRLGFTGDEVGAVLERAAEAVTVNWWILGGGLFYAVFTLFIGLRRIAYDQEIVFVGSMAIVLFLMTRLLRELDLAQRRNLLGTAIIIFVFRALPGPGSGATWWQIDKLGFDQRFIATLSLISGGLALLGMVLFRRFMAEKSIAYVVAFLTVAGTLLGLPVIGMYYGLHHWTAALTGGVVDARFIAVVDTALESPLGQVAMIPMLAWIANSAPAHLKATFFAVMASFTNLALSMASLGTKYLNRIFVVTREVPDPLSATAKVPENYSELGLLLITVTLIGLVLPMLTIFIVQRSRWRSS